MGGLKAKAMQKGADVKKSARANFLSETGGETAVLLEAPAAAPAVAAPAAAEPAAETKQASAVSTPWLPLPWVPVPADAEWATGYAVLYKTSAMIFDGQGGATFASIPLWKVMPASCEGSQLRVRTSGSEHVLEFVAADQAAEWATKMNDLVSGGTRADAKSTVQFIADEEVRLAQEHAHHEGMLTHLTGIVGGAVGGVAHRLGDTVLGQDDLETAWVGDGVRKGIKGLGAGVFSGVTDLVHETTKGAKKDGTLGLAKGLAKGAASLGQNTARGVAGLAANVAEGVAATVDLADSAQSSAKSTVGGAASWMQQAVHATEAPEPTVSRMAVRFSAHLKIQWPIARGRSLVSALCAESHC